MNKRPDFIIIGTQGGGTSTLKKYLTSHPKIRMAASEVHYFDVKYQKGLEWYMKKLPNNEEGKYKIGEKSPYYMFHPKIAERIKKVFPETKIIMILRNPVDRAFSQYKKNVCKHKSELLSFEKAIKMEDQRIAGETEKLMNDDTYISYNHREYSYLKRGIYIEQVKQWFEHFSRNQILVVKSERLFNQPQKALNKIFNFLGVNKIKIDTPVIVNKTISDLKMKEKTRQRLEKFYQPYNTQLESLLNRKFNWT